MVNDFNIRLKQLESAVTSSVDKSIFELTKRLDKQERIIHILQRQIIDLEKHNRTLKSQVQGLQHTTNNLTSRR